jgi:NTE family protein
MLKGSPFFTTETVHGQRAMDRLARKLANLTIGFAMGSGAAFGYALIGMLRVLEREGIHPDVVSGTSMGALIGAFYSAGINAEEMERIASSIDKKKLWMMADPIIPRTGIIRGNGVLNFLRSHLNDRTFTDLLLPFACVATDIQTGKEIILDRGNVAEAVRASLSLPFFFQPYYLDGRYLVDGGLVNPVPTSIIVAQGANILISANLTSKANERRVPRMIGWWRRHLPNVLRGPSIPEIMLKTIYIMQYEISQSRSEIAHVVMNIKSHDLLWWDLDRAKEMIKMGEATAEEVIPKIKSLLPFFADSCQIRLTRKGRKNF